jgi:crossover junction endodeoxyribonuclease RusA
MIIVVRGTPAPQGSKRHIGNGRMIEMSKAVGPWREAVRSQCQLYMDSGASAFVGAVTVGINFYLPRPKSLHKSVLWPAKRPDLDKLARAVLDGLTDGGAWLDDGQVVRLQLAKHYAGDGNPPGCDIEIVPMHDLPHAPLHDLPHNCTRKETA